MIQVNTVGLLTENASSTLDFYKNVLEIERIQNLGNKHGLTLFKLESRRIEVEETIIQIRDRLKKCFNASKQRLRLVCSLKDTVEKLKNNGAAISEAMGCCTVSDPNGIEWQLSDINERSLN